MDVNVRNALYIKPDLLTTWRRWSMDLRPLSSSSTDSVIVFFNFSFPRREVVEKFRTSLDLRLGTRLRKRQSDIGDQRRSDPRPVAINTHRLLTRYMFLLNYFWYNRNTRHCQFAEAKNPWVCPSLRKSSVQLLSRNIGRITTCGCSSWRLGLKTQREYITNQSFDNSGSYNGLRETITEFFDLHQILNLYKPFMVSKSRQN
jgi:hypothetical protein